MSYKTIASCCSKMPYHSATSVCSLRGVGHDMVESVHKWHSHPRHFAFVSLALANGLCVQGIRVYLRGALYT